MDENAGAHLIVVRAPEEIKGYCFMLGTGVTNIGRACPKGYPSILIDDSSVSRLHAEIAYAGGKYHIRDFSKYGTTINSELLQPEKPYILEQDSIIGLAVVDEEERVLLKFHEGVGVTTTLAPGIRKKWLRIDDRKKDVTIDGKVYDLTPSEYHLLRMLYEKSNIVCSRDDIIAAVWPEAQDTSAISDASVDQLIFRLRKHIERDPASPRRLVSKKGYGYYLNLIRPESDRLQ